MPRYLFLLAAGAVVVVAAVAAVLVYRSNNNGTPGQRHTAGGEASHGDRSRSLRIGLVTSLSGDLAPYGPATEEAARIAVQVVNAAARRAGPDAVTADLVAYEDDRTHPEAGLQAARKLIQSNRATVLIGALASSVTGALARAVAVPDRVLLISPASTAPALSALADGGYVWRTAPSDALQARVLVDLVRRDVGPAATVNVGARDDAYGRALAGRFSQGWRARGGSIGQTARWQPDQTSFGAVARRLVAGHPDAWVLVAYPRRFERLAPALLRAGWKPGRTFATDGLRATTLPATAGQAATDGMRGTAPTSSGAPTRAFDRLFRQRARAGVQQQQYAANTFDAVIVACLAAIRARSVAARAIKANLRAVSSPPGTKYTFEHLDAAIRAVLDGEDIDYQGASGPVDFDNRGDLRSARYEIWRFDRGGIERLRSVAEPAS